MQIYAEKEETIVRIMKKSEKGLLSLVLVAAILLSIVACTIVVRAEQVDDLTAQGADNYYLWGLNTNDPDFGAMTSPTGSFSYDGTKGYYYYDLQGASGDYCFVVSTVNNSGAAAQRSQAVSSVANAGKYYLSSGNYHGYSCMHIWNQSGDAVRIYFSSTSAGLNAIPLSEAGNTPTVKPTTSPQNPTTTPTPVDNGYVYCQNDAGWGAVYAYMWSGENQNAAWPGVKMENIGNNVWRYNVTGSYANIIFNVGSDAQQTDDLTYPGAGKIYNNSTGQWSTYGGSTTPTTAPVTPTTQPQNPTTPTPGGNVVYCENEAGWGSVNAYMWNSATDSNASWPGVKMTSVGNNIWQYNIPKSYTNIIFSENGNNQTTDLTFPGSGYIYNNKTGQWSIYDTSPLQVQSFTTDVEAPQYAGTAITLSASATGQGTVYYKFSVGSTVLQDYSTKKTALWKPASAGTYTLTYEFKDSAGNTNKRTKSYQVTDGASSSAPFIKQVTPANGQQIKKSAACKVTVSAGGGNTGTKLLFYKYTVKDASGNIVNVPYYTKNTSFSFTPTALGKYTVTVSVQGSDNATVERDYIYDSVTNPSEQTDATIPSDPTQPTTVQPTTKPTPGTLLGDADMDGDVTVMDATRIQRWLADLVGDSEINKTNADVDRDGEVTVMDATRIQRKIAGLIEVF